MVSGRGGNYALFALGGGEFAHAVEGTAEFVSTRALQVLGLQENLLPNQLAQKVAVQNRGLKSHLAHVEQGGLEISEGRHLSCSHKDKV